MGSAIEGAEYYRSPEISSQLVTGRADDVSLLQDNARPGDLLLIRTRGLLFSVGRKATRNDYDHVAVMLDSRRTLNIVNPKAVILPLSVFNRPGSAPLLMRPQWSNRGERELFLETVGNYADCEYDLRKTILGIITTCLYSWIGVRVHLRKPGNSSPKWICTEAILASLATAMPDFHAVHDIRLDYNRLGFATTNDFFRIARCRPNLLSIVEY